MVPPISEFQKIDGGGTFCHPYYTSTCEKSIAADDCEMMMRLSVHQTDGSIWEESILKPSFIDDDRHEQHL